MWGVVCMQGTAARTGDAKTGRGDVMLRGSGRGADPNSVKEALWVLLLSYLDASLPGQQPYHSVLPVGPSQTYPYHARHVIRGLEQMHLASRAAFSDCVLNFGSWGLFRSWRQIFY